MLACNWAGQFKSSFFFFSFQCNKNAIIAWPCRWQSQTLMRKHWVYRLWIMTHERNLNLWLLTIGPTWFKFETLKCDCLKESYTAVLLVECFEKIQPFLQLLFFFFFPATERFQISPIRNVSCYVVLNHVLYINPLFVVLAVNSVFIEFLYKVLYIVTTSLGMSLGYLWSRL